MKTKHRFRRIIQMIPWLCFNLALSKGSTPFSGHCDVSEKSSGCPVGSFHHGSYCYSVSTARAPYTEAKVACKARHGTLTHISNDETEHFVMSLRDQLLDHTYWVGINGNKKRHWTCTTNENSSDATKWNPVIQNFQWNDNNSDNMEYLYDFLWDYEFCAAEERYICEFTGPTCDGSYPSLGDSCFNLSREKCSLESAYRKCNESGGQLAIIDSKVKFWLIQNLICNERLQFNKTFKQVQQESMNRGLFMWIGVERSHSGWIYSNGTNVNYSSWDFGEPDNRMAPEDCVGIQTAWHDRNCQSNLIFSCQFPLEPPGQHQVIVEHTVSALELKPTEHSALKESSLAGIMVGCAFAGGIVGGGIVAAFLFWIIVKRRYLLSGVPRCQQVLDNVRVRHIPSQKVQNNLESSRLKWPRLSYTKEASQFTHYDDIGPSYLDILPEGPSIHTYEQIQVHGKFHDNFNPTNAVQDKYSKKMSQKLQNECESKTTSFSGERPFCKTL